MASQADVREIQDNKPRRKRRFDKADFDHIAEFIIDEHRRRQRARGDLERKWQEIDRQIEMTPDVSFKKDANGKPDVTKAWMAEMELPLQSETLEVLTADARRMMFPDSGPWFRAHAALSDEYLDRIDFQSLITGDTAEVPSQINQDNADKLVEGWLSFFHRQYDFFGHYDLINAEAFKYGTGIGRARMVRKSIFMKTARGIVRENRLLPVLLPRSIKNVYLDDSPHHLMNEGFVVGPSVIASRFQRLEDVVLAANRGSTDPDNENGGWMPASVRNLEANKDGDVELLEFEGDLIVPRKTVRSIFIPGALVTVAVGGKKGEHVARAVVRFRFRKLPTSSYILHPYHQEDQNTAYASSPLLKGMPIQKAATDAFNRLMDAAALRNSPPVRYNRDDMYFAQEGGPIIRPYEQWGTTDPVDVMEIGDPQAMLAIYQFLLQQYANETGITAPRLGEQTVSHTTAFAKEAELNRGTVRTVDYVRATGLGPVTQFLNLEYQMSRAFLGNAKQTIYLDSYRGYVDIGRQDLPDVVTFDWFGSAGPAERQQARQERLAAAQLAIQLDQIAVQLGNQPSLDVPALIEQVLREGGWIDTDAITRTDIAAGGAAPASAVPGIDEGGGGPATAALQAIAG